MVFVSSEGELAFLKAHLLEVYPAVFIQLKRDMAAETRRSCCQC
jgi:hypothetical protein